MVAPLVALGIASAGLGGLYKVGKAVDNHRYWNDYYRNTGFRPRYPYRAGYYDWMDYTYSAGMKGFASYGLYKKYYR